MTGRDYEVFKDVLPVKLLEVLMEHSSMEKTLTLLEVTHLLNDKFVKECVVHGEDPSWF